MSSWAPKLGFLMITNKIGEVVSTIPSKYLIVWLARVADVCGLEAIGFNVETVEVCQSSDALLLVLTCNSIRISSSKYGILEDSRASGEGTFCIWTRRTSLLHQTVLEVLFSQHICNHLCYRCI